MQPKVAPSNKKEKKEKKEKNGKSGTKAGKAVAAVGKLLQAARPGRFNGAREADEEGNETIPSSSPQDSGTPEPLSPSSPMFRVTSEVSVASAVSLTNSSEFSDVPATVYAPRKLAAVVNMQTNGKAGLKAGGLIATQPVEDFLAQGLLPVPAGLLQVSPLEPFGSVVEKIYQWRLRSCIVAFPDGKKEFFDCMDLACSILEAVSGPDGMPVENQDWEAAKRKLRTMAEAPVGNAVRGPRGSGEFLRFDAEGSLCDLILLFSTLKRVPVYRRGELCRVVTPSDILEMCCCVSEDTADCLESTFLTEMTRVWPGMLSEIQASDDFSVIEVLQAMRDGEVTVAPVVESLGRMRSDSSITRTASIGSTCQDPSDGSIARTLVGQFDTAALRVMLVHLDPDEGSWWWEDGSLTRNILLEPCMDYLSLSGTVIVTNSEMAPFNIMKAEETLARSIARVLASNYQSVVVYPSTGPGGDSQASARGEPKYLNGTVSTLALVVAMLQGGLFEVLRFDPLKPRRETPELLGSPGRNHRRQRTCSKISIPDTLNASEDSLGGKLSKVKFCPTVELDCLDVPTCPQHGIRFLKFVQDGEGKYPMDFRSLRDLGDGSRVAGAAAQCTACSRPLGRVRLRSVSSPMSPPVAASSSGLFDMALSDSGTWFGLPFLGRNPENGGFVRSSSSSPMASALKRGTNFPLKKSKTAERLDAIRAQQEAKTGETSNGGSKGRSFFGVCCSPCRMVNDKDQIQASGISVIGGEAYSREDTGNTSGGLGSGIASANSSDGGNSPQPLRSSGRSSPMGRSASDGKNGGSFQSSGATSATGSDRASTNGGGVPRLPVPGMAVPATRVVREGTDRARVVEVKDGTGVRRSVSEPTASSGFRKR